MGDRITTYYPCQQPNCNGEVEEYDASSSLIFVAACDTCHWKDPRSYYELSGSEIVLCTEEKARELGALVVCPACSKEVMKSWIEKDRRCMECHWPKKFT
jgi:hypothetical protein